MAFAKEFSLLDTAGHNVKQFNCGKPCMDKFLKRFAAKHMKLRISSTWVLPVLKDPHPARAQIAAYYTLGLATVKREEIPSNKSLPAYRIPVVLLARLAVDKAFSRQGLGGKTLITALRKAVELTENGLGAVGLALDVPDEEALRFYRKYEDLEPFTHDPMRLFVSMNVLKQLS